MKRTPTLLTASLRGIGAISRQELAQRLGPRVSDVAAYHTRNFDYLRFEFAGAVEELLTLHTVEDLFFVVAEMPLSGRQEDLEALRLQLRSSPAVEAGLRVHKEVTRAAGTPAIPFRVVAQADDAGWRHYRRVDLQSAAERALRERYRRWKLVPEEARVEFWVIQPGRRAFAGIRLSDRSLRQRDYKAAHLPGSLRPTIAAALVYLSDVRADDVFLDPMCGAGTILIERARAGRYQALLGGDLDPQAVQATLENLGGKHKPWEVQRWDARRLPLPDQSVSVVVTNPPWGRKIGSPQENRELYARLFGEARRVLREGGRMVVLSSEWDLIKSILAQEPGFRLRRKLQNVSVLGRHADILVLSKAETGPTDKDSGAKETDK